jgi:hypothetical protein
MHKYPCGTALGYRMTIENVSPASQCRRRHVAPTIPPATGRPPGRPPNAPDQPHEDSCFLCVQPRGPTEAEALCAGGVSPTPNLQPTPFTNWTKPIGRSFHWVESSIAPLLTVASVLSRLELSSASDTRSSLDSLEGRYGFGSCFSAEFFPSSEVCSISALIAPPIRMKRPLRYIQVSSTITASMLPEVALYEPK